MYKVFIDNKSVIFKVKDEDGLKKEFPDYKYIEAAGGLVQHNNTFLFIKRNGVWDIPKGKLDKGETPEIAAVREIEEECGLVKPVIIRHLVDTWHTYEHKGKMVLKKTYWYWLKASETKMNLVPQTEEGITEVAFFNKTEFAKIKADTFLSILEVIEALEKKIQ
ncbi:MAG: NUDIX domain-containing protein [Crocinitomicaceae bacterium]|nr:NUDIX domain-containing protein [Crocinitomicaceae bacterium]